MTCCFVVTKCMKVRKIQLYYVIDINKNILLDMLINLKRNEALLCYFQVVFCCENVYAFCAHSRLAKKPFYSVLYVFNHSLLI